MSYKIAFTQSPSYTPNSQTRAAYGRPRTIEFGAGHWWDDPSRQPSFGGVIASLTNPNRQVSAHAVVTAGEVRELVRQEDTAWATGNANPYTFSIETDPRITTGGAVAEQIMATLAEYIADKGFHNLQWFPHKHWMTTGCNPIDWGEVMRRAKETWQQKYGQPAVKETNREVYNPLKKFVVAQDCILEYIPNGGNAGSRTYKKGEQIDIKQKLTMSDGSVWYRTQYSSDNELATGFRAQNLTAVVEVPEWQRNLKDITPVNLMVLVPQTPLVNLNDGSVIKQLGQGTNIDFVKSTTVGGVEYLISSYSATNAMPNGIKRADVGVPAQPPVNEKPEWLKNWQDIADVKMYARADTDLVNLENGSTIKVIPRATEIAVASTTEWHGQKYAITEYSTAKNLAQGIRIDDLDMKPIENPTTPVEPAPNQPTIEENVNWLVKAVKALLAFFGIKLS